MSIQALAQVRLAGQAQTLGTPLSAHIGIDAGSPLNAGHVSSAIARHAHTCNSHEATAKALCGLLPQADTAAIPAIHAGCIWLFINGKPYASRL